MTNAAAASRRMPLILDVSSACLDTIRPPRATANDVRRTRSLLVVDHVTVTHAVRAPRPTPLNQDASCACLALTLLTMVHADHVPMAWFRRQLERSLALLATPARRSTVPTRAACSVPSAPSRQTDSRASHVRAPDLLLGCRRRYVRHRAQWHGIMCDMSCGPVQHTLEQVHSMSKWHVLELCWHVRVLSLFCWF